MEELHERTIKSDAIGFSVAIMALASQQRATVLELLVEMLEREPNAIAFEKGSQWQKALGMLQEMVSGGVLPKNAIHSLVCVASFLRRLEVPDNSTEVQIHRYSCEFAIERLRALHHTCW